MEEHGPSIAKNVAVATCKIIFLANPLTNQIISEPEEPTMHELESKAAVRSSLLSESEGDQWQYFAVFGVVQMHFSVRIAFSPTTVISTHFT